MSPRLLTTFGGLAVLLSTLISACSSTTLIRSQPAGAKVYINGEPVGRTPYAYTDTAIVGTTNQVRLTLDGFEDVSGSFSRSEQFSPGACAGGVFFLVPFLWVMDYKPEHNYELSPAVKPAAAAAATGEAVHTAPKASKAHKAHKVP